MSVPRRPRGFASAGLLLALMFAGSLGLWVGVPLAWLWIGGRVQGATHSLGLAVLVALAGVAGTIVMAVPLLGALNRRYEQARAARGLDDLGNAPLEGVMVVSAALALIAFVGWFFFLSGTEPIPIGFPK